MHTSSVSGDTLRPKKDFAFISTIICYNLTIGL